MNRDNIQLRKSLYVYTCKHVNKIDCNSTIAKNILLTSVAFLHTQRNIAVFGYIHPGYLDLMAVI